MNINKINDQNNPSVILVCAAIFAAWGAGIATGVSIYKAISSSESHENEMEDETSQDQELSSLDCSFRPEDISNCSQLNTSTAIDLAFDESDIARSHLDSETSSNFEWASPSLSNQVAFNAATEFLDPSLSPNQSFKSISWSPLIGQITPPIKEEGSSVTFNKKTLNQSVQRQSLQLNNKKSRTVRLLAYRCQSADLLMDNEDAWEHIDRGLVVYVSFAQSAVEETVQKVAKQILALPILTEGEWGDGKKTVSILDMARKGLSPGLMVVPQAALVCKFNGRTMQYHEQISKEAGENLYSVLIAQLKTSVAMSLGPKKIISGKEHGKLHRENLQQSLSIPPAQLFKQGKYTGLFSSFNEEGFPLLDASGKELPKSQKKKLEKIYKSHRSRYDKAKKLFEGEGADEKEAASQPDNEEKKEVDQPQQKESKNGTEEVNPDILRMVFGTWGSRQGLKMTAECGPFSHILEF